MTTPPNCPLCGESGREIIASQRLLDPAVRSDGADLPERQVEYASCPGCGTVSMHPLPDQATLDGYYGADALEEGDEKQNRAMSRIATMRMIMLRQVTRLSGGTALDVGAGPGRMLDSMGRILGLRALGLEPSTGYPERDDVLRTTLADFAPPAGWPDVYDLVTCCNVIEHVTDPAAFLDGLCARVADGGWLMVEVPSGERLARGEPCPYGPNIYPLHLHHLSAVGLIEALARRGLRTVRCSDIDTGKYPALDVLARRDDVAGDARRFLAQYEHQQAAARQAGERLAALAAEGPVLVWGAGVDLFEVLAAMNPDATPDITLCDRSPAKQGRRLAGHEIHDPDSLGAREFAHVVAGARHPSLAGSILDDARRLFPRAQCEPLFPSLDWSPM